jgi:L-ribulose-5-phosphate 3-epimerase
MENILAGHTNTYHTYTLDEALAGISAAGFQYVELSAVPGWTDHVPVGSSEQELDELQRKLNRFGLKPSALSGHGSPEQALTMHEGVEHAKRGIQLAARLGIPIFNTAIGGHDPNVLEDERAFLMNIGEVADEAEKYGITVGLEIHGVLMASAHDCITLIQRIGRSNIGINYDTANVTYYSGRLAEDDIKIALPYLVHVHLKDTAGGKGEWNFPAIGSGRINWAGIFQILEDGGYRGPFSVELEFQGEPWPPLEQVNEAMRRSYEFLQPFFAPAIA